MARKRSLARCRVADGQPPLVERGDLGSIGELEWAQTSPLQFCVGRIESCHIAAVVTGATANRGFSPSNYASAASAYQALAAGRLS